MKSINYKYVDLQNLKEDTFGDIDIFKEIIELFIELIEEYIKVLNEELGNKNWPVLFKATHKIKPNINMFGIKALEPIILKLDYNFRNEQNLDDVDSLVKTSIVIFNEVKKELLNELNAMRDE